MPVIKQSKRKQPETKDYDSCSDFEDELNVNNCSERYSKKKKLILESESESDSCVSETAENEIVNCETLDEDKTSNKVLEKSQVNKNSKKMNVSTDSSDEDDSLVVSNCSKAVDISSIKSQSDENGFESSDDDDDPKSEIIKTSKQNGKTMKTSFVSSSDDEPVVAHTYSVDSESKKSSKKVSDHEENRFESSDDDDPKNKIIKTSKQNGKTMKTPSVSSSDDEPVAVHTYSVDSESKKSSKKVSDHEENSYISSDEDEPLGKFQKSTNIKVKKAKSLSNNKIEHLKKYLRLSGIHIQSYDKLFVDCKSIKSKTEKLLSILHEKGLKGRPTIEKCKKLRKKIETKKEISELDMSNIIQLEGRPKRRLGGITQKAAKIENSPGQKSFSRLKDIIDSEESD